MSGKWMFRLWMAIGGLCVASAAEAAPPWSDLISLNRVDTDQAKPYKLVEENGPWMVMACSFSGKGAEKQAHELVLELRKRYKLPAYVYLGHFDPGKAQFRGVDQVRQAAQGRLLQIPGYEERGTPRPRGDCRVGGELSGGRRPKSPVDAAHAQVRQAEVP